MYLVYTLLFSTIDLRASGNRYNGSLTPGVSFRDQDGIFEKSAHSFYTVGQDAYLELFGPAQIDYPGVVLDVGSTLTIQSQSAVLKSVQLLCAQYGVQSKQRKPPSVIIESDGHVALNLFVAEGGSRFKLGSTTHSDLHLNHVHLKGYSDFECNACSDENPSEIQLGRHAKVDILRLSSSKTEQLHMGDFAKLVIKDTDVCSLGNKLTLQRDASLRINKASSVAVNKVTHLLEESKARLDFDSTLECDSLIVQPKGRLQMESGAQLIAPNIVVIVAGDVVMKEGSSLLIDVTTNLSGMCLLRDLVLDTDHKAVYTDISHIHGISCFNSAVMFKLSFLILINCLASLFHIAF